MGLLDLVKEDNRVRAAADLLRQLACLIVAHIAGRRTDELGDGVLFHIFGHIQTDQTVHTVEQVISQPLDQLCLAHTGGTNENEGHRPLLGADANAAAANCPGNRIHCLILANDVFLQTLRQALDLLVLLGLDLGSRDFRPQFNDPGQILHGHRRLRKLFQLLNLGRDLQQLAAQHRQTLKVLILGILVEHPQLQLVIIPLLLQLCQFADLLALQVHIGTGFVQQIDCLVRQEPVGDVALG